jgi:hypothetical protein
VERCVISIPQKVGATNVAVFGRFFVRLIFRNCGNQRDCILV